VNKYAAEEVAQEYYNLGVQLALQDTSSTKTAGAADKVLRGTAGLYGAGAGAMATPLALAHMGQGRAVSQAMEGLLGNSPIYTTHPIAALMAPAALATGILGGRGALKGHDKLVELLRSNAAAKAVKSAKK